MTRRFAHFTGLSFWCFGLLALRLVDLQLVQGSYYRGLAEQNRLRVVPEAAPRGLIVDRKGRLLAESRTAFRVSIVPQEAGDVSARLAQLSAILGKPPESLKKAYQNNRTYPFVPVTVVARISKEAALRLEEERFRLPGVLVQPEAARHYPMGSVAGPLLGYLSQPTADELPLLKPYGVQPKQLIGRFGIEQWLDEDLRGAAGGMLVEVNHRGRQVRTVGRRPPKAGSQVTLTLDAALQSLIEQSFGAQSGAAVALDPFTGAVLAMASMPAFAPEVFVVQDAPAIRALLTDPSTPLVNRAAGNAYQPGSIVKLITAAAGLDNHLLTAQTTVGCTGGMTIGDRRIHCWNRDGHGPLHLTGALMQSCNVYFMQVARWVRRERLLDGLREAGLGRKTGWGFPEKGGHLPARRLTEGELALLGIGQGELLATPLQAAVMVSIFANGGRVIQPWLVASVGGRPVERKPAQRTVRWKAGVVDAVREGMKETVRHAAGTAHRAYTPLVSVAGKTGTAQTHRAGSSHGWFVGFCPAEKPVMAIAVIAEYGGSGGDLPTEIGRTACEYMATIAAAEEND